MTQTILLRPAAFCAILFAFTLLLGCADEGVVSIDSDGAFESDQVTSDAKSGGVTTETAEVFGQGLGGAVVSGAQAKIRRSANGISATVTMPTPAPGTYNYPVGAEVGRTEAFTLWVFVFNDPEDANWDGAFLGAGHAVAGSQLTLSGHVSRQSDPFVGDGLQNPGEAKVHLAVAPHGAVDPDKLPEQIQTPAGTPAHWWFALFD